MPHSSTRIVLDVAARTHVGAKRTENEDRVLVADLDAGSAHVGAFSGRLQVGSGGALLAVCDGMGGEAGGEVASTTAVQSLFREAATALPGRSSQGVARGLLEAVRSASRDIESLAQVRVELSRMGTTATVCALAEQQLIVAQVGDSRAYLLRGERLVQLTRDQTLATLLFERGQLTLEQFDSFEFGHVILQALGHVGGVDVDLGELGLAHGDTLLICSDGLYGCVDDARVAKTLRAHEPTEACDKLIELALEAGAPDNVSCLVARTSGALPSSEAAPQLAKVVLAPEPLPEESRIEAPATVPPTERAPTAAAGPLARLRAFFQG
ncbi:MAG TPA: protein phosphatase 2C domain-containing protein [Polyangiaceae bacterium]|nr:protein phosphatase 2C domain-containing protein [Polyangiaceae bacterium]